MDQPMMSQQSSPLEEAMQRRGQNPQGQPGPQSASQPKPGTAGYSPKDKTDLILMTLAEQLKSIAQMEKEQLKMMQGGGVPQPQPVPQPTAPMAAGTPPTSPAPSVGGM